jgi:hypothetical protein
LVARYAVNNSFIPQDSPLHLHCDFAVRFVNSRQRGNKKKATVKDSFSYSDLK